MSICHWVSWFGKEGGRGGFLIFDYLLIIQLYLSSKMHDILSTKKSRKGEINLIHAPFFFFF